MRWWKGWFYPFLPSVSPRWHEKRRKGLFYRHFPAETLVCQREQDRVFWSRFLFPEKKAGLFFEVGPGDGRVGSAALGLQLLHGWKGAFLADQDANNPAAPPLGSGKDLWVVRGRRAVGRLPGWLAGGAFRPRWIVAENPAPNPVLAQGLAGVGYRLRWFCHDDEYFERQGRALR